MASTSPSSVGRVGHSLVLFNRLRPVRYYAVDLAIVGFPLVLAAPGRVLTTRTLLAVASIHLARLGGLILDDYVDREADALAAPQRPIPRGLVTPREALLLGMGALLCGVLAGAIVGPTFLGVLLVAYALLFGSVGLVNDVSVPIVATAATVTSVSLLSLLGWVAHGELSVAAGAVVLATWCWDWGHDALGAARDCTADAAAGLASLGVVLSPTGLAAVAISGLLATTALVAMLVAWTLSTAFVAAYLLVVAVSLARSVAVVGGFARGTFEAAAARRAVEWHLVATYGLATALVVLGAG